MKDELFKELVASVQEGGAILRGERTASRRFIVDGPDVKHIRASYKLSQGEFASCSASVLQRCGTGTRTSETRRSCTYLIAGSSPTPTHSGMLFTQLRNKA